MERALPKEAVLPPATPAKSPPARPLGFSALTSSDRLNGFSNWVSELNSHKGIIGSGVDFELWKNRTSSGGLGSAVDFSSVASIDGNCGFGNWVSGFGTNRNEIDNGFDSKLFIDSNRDVRGLGFGHSRMGFAGIASASSDGGFGGLSGSLCDSSHSTVESSVDVRRNSSSKTATPSDDAKMDGNPNHEKDISEVLNEGNKLRYDENSQPNAGLTSNATPSPSQKRGKRRIDLDKEPLRKPKKKRYWPKIANEIFKKTPRKTPKHSTPAPQTPKRTPHEKRKHARKKNFQTCPSDNFDPSTDLRKIKVKSMSLENADLTGNVDLKVKDPDSKGLSKSCKRALNFELDSTDARNRTVDTEQKSPATTVCRFNPLCVYRRTFRKNDCPSNSRKLGPNFPRMWKKRRNRRRKAAIYGVLCNFMTAQNGQRWVSKKVRGKRNKGIRANVGVIHHGFERGAINSNICLGSRFGGMISSTKAQTGATISDQDCFKCMMSLCPMVNRKRGRSKGLRRRRVDRYGHKALLVQCNDGEVTKEQKNIVFAPNSSVLYQNEFKGMDRNKCRASVVPALGNYVVTKVPYHGVFAPSSSMSYRNDFDGSDKTGHRTSIFIPFSGSEVTKVQNNMVSRRDAVSHRDGFEGYPVKIRDTLTLPKIFHIGPRETVLQVLDTVVKGLENLHIADKDGKLEVPDQKANHGTLVVFKKRKLVPVQKANLGTLVVFKKPKPPPPPQIDFDSETIRVWNRITGSGVREDVEEDDEEREKLWEEQRKVFGGRVHSFTARMHLIQGDRRFLRWKGSVVDSVVGVFLTQNVADVLSSSAYMYLAAKFPLQPTSNHSESDEVDEIPFGQESVGSNTEEIGEARDANGEPVLSQETEQEMTLQLEENSEVVIKTRFSSMDMGSLAHLEDINNGKMKDLGGKSNNLGCVDFFENERELLQKATQKSEEKIIDPYMSSGKFQVPLKSNSQAEKNGDGTEVFQEATQKSQEQVIDPNTSSGKFQVPLKSNSQTNRTENVSQAEKSLGTKGNKVEKKQVESVDWDNLRKTYSKGEERDHNTDTMDSLDWEAVRKAKLDKIANCIRGRGQYNIIGLRIQEFLDRVLRDHGSLDLEWLRNVPPEKAKEYLLSIKGLGLKSVECVRLLCLHHHAFPVDTNVNRIAVRLGWVPLQPLPGDIHFHLLDTYPVMDAVQKYLWPRLCTLDQRTLYELHYQMITFGKVFCTKGKPNCGPCPMKGECRHYASAVASKRLALPGLPERSIVRSNDPIPSFHNLDEHITQTALSLLKANLSNKSQSKSCEPIIEYPASPEPECLEPQVRDIEDYYSEPENEIPTIRLNAEELKENLLDYLSKINMPFPEDNMSKALVVMTSEAASKPVPKLKSVNRLRTVHHVYELPDTHPLVASLDKREPDDPSPYLLAIWTQAEAAISAEPQCNSPASELCNDCNNCQQEDSQTVRGTILIPCRTAMRGRFPLNGTYFQVNEVFADDESMKNPINVPTAWIWHLRRRDLYCATQVTSIFKGLSTEEVQYCFWRGFVCVRAFNRKTRAPRKLDRKFHISTTAQQREKRTPDK